LLRKSFIKLFPIAYAFCSISVFHAAFKQCLMHTVVCVDCAAVKLRRIKYHVSFSLRTFTNVLSAKLRCGSIYCVWETPTFQFIQVIEVTGPAAY